MTPLCALALASTVPALRIAVLREFLQRHLIFGVSFGVSFVRDMVHNICFANTKTAGSPFSGLHSSVICHIMP